MKADLLFVEGNIYDGIHPKPFQYLAVKGNCIIAIGRGSAKSFAGRHTRIIHLRGMAMVPGWIDSHMHLLDYAWSLQRVHLDACRSKTEVLNVLKERATRTIPGEWILGRGWRKPQMNGFPHRKLLDEIFPDNPAVLNSHDEHFSWANTKALGAAGLTKPIQVAGGYLGVDPDGSLDGIFGENAVPLIRNHFPKPDSASRKHSLLTAQEKLHRIGIVGLHSTDANQAFGDLQELHSESKLRLKIFHSIPVRKLDDAVRLSLKSGLGDTWFRFGFVKIFSDGALGSQTALMLEPYHETGETGIECMQEAQLTEKIGTALQNGIAVAVHAIGDRANRQALNAFEKNSAFLKIPRARSRIEHAQLLHPEDIKRFQKIGVLASMQPYHAISDHPFATRFWGERARFAYAWRSLLNAGATLIFGSDAPVEYPDPLLALDAAVNRSNWEDRSQTITPAEALRAYTLAPAAAAGEEIERGSLEVGKRADFVLLSEDPYKAAFRGLKVTGTVIEGEFVFSDLPQD
jgi:predicted amidohydrolase YtcJ